MVDGGYKKNETNLFFSYERHKIVHYIRFARYKLKKLLFYFFTHIMVIKDYFFLQYFEF